MRLKFVFVFNLITHNLIYNIIEISLKKFKNIKMSMLHYPVSQHYTTSLMHLSTTISVPVVNNNIVT